MYRLHSYLQNKQSLSLASKVIISAFIFFLSTFTHALKDDVEKPVEINADSVLFNKSKGFAVYEGNVSIVQGSLEIRASKIEINAPNSEIVKISANGSPVSFKQKMDDGKLAKGQADRAIYLVKDKRLFLDGNATLSQNNDKFSSNHIEYSMSNGELKAGDKQSSGKGRVKAIFYPSNKSK
jgi:lipopolysaccharide export system protein LptA